MTWLKDVFYTSEKHIMFFKLCVFLPIIPYFYTVYTYAVNFPLKDDYQAILQFLINFKTADLGEKVRLMFSTHNEHRIFSSRIVYVLHDFISGGINFRTLIFIANIQLIGIFIPCVFFIKRLIPGYWYVPAIIFCACIFDISSYENGDFAMAGMQNFGVIMLFALSLLCYTRHSKGSLIAAVILQSICIFSSGNGMIAAFCLVLYNIMDGDKWKKILSLSSLLICVPIYFINFEGSVGTDSLPAYDQVTNFFLGMAGAHFYNAFEIETLTGLAIIALLALVLPYNRKTVFDKEAMPVICFMAFILATILTTALFRSGFRDIAFYSSRYLIYSHILVAILFLFVFVKLQGKKLLWPTCLVLTLLMVYTHYKNYEYGIKGFDGMNYRLLNMYYYYPDRDAAKKIADEACLYNIYCIEDNR